VKNALESSQAPYEGRSYEVFLQGSYGNHTNIYAESDVDVVIRLTEIIRSDLSLLPPDQQAAYHQACGTATYTLNAFKEGVHTRLKTAFGRNSVTTGDKAFTLNRHPLDAPLTS
jgi:ABC-type Zn uptake system ZnuABC Zn-binding protein ZnuA